MTRTRHADDQRERERIVDELVTQGYDVVDDGGTATRMRKRDHGGLAAHLLVFIVFGWWTLGGANVIYTLWRRWRSVDEVVVKEV